MLAYEKEFVNGASGHAKQINHHNYISCIGHRCLWSVEGHKEGCRQDEYKDPIWDKAEDP